MSDPLKNIRDILGNMEDIVTKAGDRYEAFDAWYQKLCASAPALTREQVTLTRDNFKKAMKQAFVEGWSQRNTCGEPHAPKH